MAKILVTGASGFVGSRLVRLLAREHEVWALVRRPWDPEAEGCRQVHVLRQDLAAPWSAELPPRIDAVMHLAQSPHFRRFPESAEEIYAVSVGATMRLLAWALKAGASHFILGSTGGLYGSGEAPMHESDALPEMRNQLGFYFATKRASELLVAQYAGELKTAILRLFFVYGSGQAPHMLMPRLVGNIREGRPVYLQGEEGMRLNPIHVDDAVTAMARCLGLAEGRVFNIAGPETVTLREVAMRIGARVGRPPVLTIDATAQPNHLVADIRRMSSALGPPQIGIDAGIAELCGEAS